MVRTVQLFEDPNVSMEQLSEFYKVEGSPHTYLMFVTTIDGIAVPLEPGQRGGSEIALRHLKDNPIAAGGLTEKRDLHNGWGDAHPRLRGAGIRTDKPKAALDPTETDSQGLI